MSDNVPSNWGMPNQASNMLGWDAVKEALAAVEVTPAPAPFGWCCCVLWDPLTLEKLQEHRGKWGSALYSKLAIAGMLTDNVVRENPAMDREKPFLLLQRVAPGIQWDGDLGKVRVMELTTEANKAIPEKDRLYDLVMSKDQEMDCILEEITRLPALNTVIMLWNFVLNTFEEPLWEESGAEKIAGRIFPKEAEPGCIPTVLIFHEEKLSRDRVIKLTNEFYGSEMKGFDKDGIQRFTNRTMLSKEESQLSIHLSRAFEGDEDDDKGGDARKPGHPILDIRYYDSDVSGEEEEKEYAEFRWTTTEDEDSGDERRDAQAPLPIEVKGAVAEEEEEGIMVVDADKDSDIEVDVMQATQEKTGYESDHSVEIGVKGVVDSLVEEVTEVGVSEEASAEEHSASSHHVEIMSTIEEESEEELTTPAKGKDDQPREMIESSQKDKDEMMAIDMDNEENDELVKIAEELEKEEQPLEMMSANAEEEEENNKLGEVVESAEKKKDEQPLEMMSTNAEEENNKLGEVVESAEKNKDDQPLEMAMATNVEKEQETKKNDESLETIEEQELILSPKATPVLALSEEVGFSEFIDDLLQLNGEAAVSGGSQNSGGGTGVPMDSKLQPITPDPKTTGKHVKFDKNVIDNRGKGKAVADSQMNFLYTQQVDMSTDETSTEDDTANETGTTETEVDTSMDDENQLVIVEESEEDSQHLYRFTQTIAQM